MGSQATSISTWCRSVEKYKKKGIVSKFAFQKTTDVHFKESGNCFLLLRDIIFDKFLTPVSHLKVRKW